MFSEAGVSDVRQVFIDIVMSGAIAVIFASVIPSQEIFKQSMVHPPLLPQEDTNSSAPIHQRRSFPASFRWYRHLLGDDSFLVRGLVLCIVMLSALFFSRSFCFEPGGFPGAAAGQR